VYVFQPDEGIHPCSASVYTPAQTGDVRAQQCCTVLYLEATAADPAGKTISKFVHFFTVQRRLLVVEVRDELFTNLQALLGVLRQDSRHKIVKRISLNSSSHSDKLAAAVNV